MTPEERTLLNRLKELSSRADEQSVYTHTGFLTPAEQAFAAEHRSELALPPRPIGGFPEAERVILQFGSPEEFGYEEEPPLALLLAVPRQEKFAEEFSHRDILGALMGSGIRRDQLGDILLEGTHAYIFCLDQIAEHLLQTVESFRHTPVRLQRLAELPPGIGVKLEAAEIVAASDRLDSIIGAAYHLSRAAAKELVQKELAAIDGKLCTDPSRELHPADKISVRGYGKLYYDGPLRETRSGRLRFAVRYFR